MATKLDVLFGAHRERQRGLPCQGGLIIVIDHGIRSREISLDTYFLLYDRVSKWNHIDLIDIIYLTDLRNLF